jgi:hypothetical protein
VKQQVYKKYGWTLVLAILLLWTLLTPSHFQKGGVDIEFYFAIALFVATISILINLLFDNVHWVERILISLLFAFISLFLTTLILGPNIVAFFYSDKTWFLWETKHRIIINAVYYGLNAAILRLFSIVYFKVRGQLKNKRNFKKATA